MNNFIKTFPQKKFGLFLLFLFILTLNACTPVPRYKSIATYIPPNTPQGSSCVKNCEKIKINCKIQCDACNTQEVISKRAEINANKIQCIGTKYADSCMTMLNYMKPSYQKIQGECKELCKCKAYRDCYLGCGGKIHTERKCVKNC